MSEVSETYNGSSGANDNEGKSLKVTVFAASSMMKDPGYADDAEYVGRKLAEHGDELLYGGGSYGLMGAVSQAALDSGGKITGYMMDCFVQEGEYLQKEHEVICKTLATRKQEMLLAADAYIALGGGFGTLDEIMEAGIEQYMGGYVDPPVKKKPIILINRNGIYDPLMAQLDNFIEEGSARPEVKAFFTLVKDGREAIRVLETLTSAPAEDAVPIGNVNVSIHSLRKNNIK